MDNTIFIIAEMACSHEGQPDLAKKIIDASAKANSDAIQLQIWSLEYMMAPQRKEYNILQKIELLQKQWKDLIEYTRDKYPCLQIYVCVYEHVSIDFIDGMDIDGYKINSSDLSNPVVLDKVAATGRPVNLSIGASTLGEIQEAIERVKAVSNSQITLMYGHQSFPTLPENVHLNYINKLKQLFELPVGYQDHCDAETDAAFWLPAASVGMGVNVIEKHITHDRSFRGIDHESALNPDEFCRFVDMVRTLDSAMGISTPRPFSADEIKYREFQKKSIVAACDLDVGTLLDNEHIAFVRADKLGISPDKVHLFIGKTVKRKIAAFQTLSEKDIE